ncbi:hypothetical protein [Phaeobacter gallaeciensis]|nr:hypothetical protein [Phaeobacter gallaeciensis]MDE4100293.1 hypothetical protein [Phaeobacter gallaeciensis]MDE4109097.1 hypothetical protein [Phaeobacter gallaeciensis]MDE4113564.1 hypothetical protein [Phaeobacter gallaeciensis]MDE4118032.1 hypothetical protein [Phaeobacter gallaeciensis]MDE4122510.1 hypothetical protein [Phaeobacter gallaeciensis]
MNRLLRPDETLKGIEMDDTGEDTVIQPPTPAQKLSTKLLLPNSLKGGKV